MPYTYNSERTAILVAELKQAKVITLTDFAKADIDLTFLINFVQSRVPSELNIGESEVTLTPMFPGGKKTVHIDAKSFATDYEVKMEPLPENAGKSRADRGPVYVHQLDQVAWLFPKAGILKFDDGSATNREGFDLTGLRSQYREVYVPHIAAEEAKREEGIKASLVARGFKDGVIEPGMKVTIRPFSELEKEYGSVKVDIVPGEVEGRVARRAAPEYGYQFIDGMGYLAGLPARIKTFDEETGKVDLEIDIDGKTVEFVDEARYGGSAYMIGSVEFHETHLRKL